MFPAFNDTVTVPLPQHICTALHGTAVQARVRDVCYKRQASRFSPCCRQWGFLRQLNLPTDCSARPLRLLHPPSFLPHLAVANLTHSPPRLISCCMHLTETASYARFDPVQGAHDSHTSSWSAPDSCEGLTPQITPCSFSPVLRVSLKERSRAAGLDSCRRNPSGIAMPTA